MRCPGILVWTIVSLAASLAEAPRVSAAPLLVVVESVDGGAPDAEGVRRSIQAELGTPVVAPVSADQTTSDLLVVAIDKSKIRMSLRTSTAAVVTRTIDASGDRATRTREIAWLAGNLARDQVGPLIAAESLPERPINPAGSSVNKPAAPLQPAPIVAAPPAQATDAPSPPPERSLQPVEVASAAGAPAPANKSPRWSVTAAGGTTVGTNLRAKLSSDGIFPFEPAYQLEVAHDTGAGSVILGTALDMGSSTSNRLAGLAGFAGTSRRFGRWLLETTAGAGVELVTMIIPSYTFAQGATNVEASSTIRTALYLRGAGTIGLALSPNIDFLVGLTVHLTTAGSSFDFAGGTAGLRYRLP